MAAERILYYGTHSILQTWYDALSVKPSNTLMDKLNTLIWGLAFDNNLEEFDLFHVIGGLETDEQRLRPIITTSATKTFTNVGSATLNLSGVTGNGIASYLNTNWTPSINGVKFTLNNACFGCYNRTSGVDNGVDMGCTDGTGFDKLYIKWTDNSAYIRVNNNSVSGIPNSDPLSLASTTRSASNAQNIYMRGVSIGSDSTASTSLPNRPIFLCAYNNQGVAAEFSLRNQSLVFAGSNSINQLNFYNRIQAYMTSVGINV